MKIVKYKRDLTTGALREGLIVQIGEGSGEIAPLPGWSRESLQEAENQMNEIAGAFEDADWTLENYAERLLALNLFPSVEFGLESAILSSLSPVKSVDVKNCALLMGRYDEIISQAGLRRSEGYKFAKLKVGSLSFDEARDLIIRFKDVFRLRVDVNRAWKTNESLAFFSEFGMDGFDYVEEPFSDPFDLEQFTLPFAVDESFPEKLTLGDLEKFQNLKALVYKPTIQGGMLRCVPLFNWAKQRGVEIVLSSSFETELGLSRISEMAARLSLQAPLGLGTIHFIKK